MSSTIALGHELETIKKVIGDLKYMSGYNKNEDLTLTVKAGEDTLLGYLFNDDHICFKMVIMTEDIDFLIQERKRMDSTCVKRNNNHWIMKDEGCTYHVRLEKTTSSTILTYTFN
jgi:hypothetical protein